MDPKDLIASLDLESALAAPIRKSGRPGPAATGSALAARPTTLSSTTALRLDDWGVRQGRELIDRSPRIAAATQGDPTIAADFFGAAFLSEPEMAPSCLDTMRRDYVEQLMNTPEYRALHATTALDVVAAELAATSFCEAFGELLGKRSGGIIESDRKLKPAVPSALGGGRKSLLRPRPAGDDEFEVSRAVARGITRAEEEVEQLCEARGAFGMGPAEAGQNDANAIVRLFKRVRQSDNLRKICELAGKFRRAAQGRQRMKTTHGFDEMIGVGLGDEIGRLISSELGMLATEEFGDDVLRRLVERGCMVREYQSEEPAAKGPILVTIDESGSMMGDKVQSAKALALALAWIARKQKRWCGLIAFSGESGHRLLALPPGRWDEVALADWLEACIGGGSYRDVPTAELPDFYAQIGAPAGKTDLVMITDAICHLEPREKADFVEWKKTAKVKATGLIIASSAGDLEDICEECYELPALTADSDEVLNVLSV